MKTLSKTAIAVFLISLLSLNLNAMQQDQNENAQKLFQEIEQYAQNHKKKINDLKQQLNLSSEYYHEDISLAFASCFILANEILGGKTEKLEIVLNNQETFQNFITEKNLAPILSYVFTYALEAQQINCITTIVEKYKNLYGCEILSDFKQLNKEKQLDQFLEKLISNKDRETVKMLISHEILNIIKQKEKLAKLANAKGLDEVAFLINKKIENDRNFVLSWAAGFSGLALVILIIYIYFSSY